LNVMVDEKMHVIMSTNLPVSYGGRRLEAVEESWKNAKKRFWILFVPNGHVRVSNKHRHGID
jgi:hypothetical protein